MLAPFGNLNERLAFLGQIIEQALFLYGMLNVYLYIPLMVNFSQNIFQ